MSPKLKEAIEGIALQKPPIPAAAICRQARRLAQDLGEEPPSYWLVHRIVAALPADLVTLAHDGTKAYNNAFELVHRREADGPNAIGMPGLEKRLARYPQFYSRIGFVHEFRPLGTTEIRQLLEQRRTPPDVNLPAQPWAEDAVAAIIRITGGNFRLLTRLLTQMERILEINSLQQVNKAVVDAARESLVIGQA